jgi:hypothetical protein
VTSGDPGSVIYPPFLIQALEHTGWTRAGGTEGKTVILAGPPGALAAAAVTIPVDEADQAYRAQMGRALAQLREHGVRESLLAGTPGRGPGEGIVP